MRGEDRAARVKSKGFENWRFRTPRPKDKMLNLGIFFFLHIEWGLTRYKNVEHDVE